MAEFSTVIIFDIETNDLETLPHPDRRYSSRASENADFRRAVAHFSCFMCFHKILIYSNNKKFKRIYQNDHLFNYN